MLFWNRYYWISSCQRCHRGFKQSIEADGESGIDVLALSLGLKPLHDWLIENKSHHWLDG